MAADSLMNLAGEPLEILKDVTWEDPKARPLQYGAHNPPSGSCAVFCFCGTPL